MTTRSGQEYSVYEQTMSQKDQVGNSSGEPGLTQLPQALLTTRDEEKCWERARQEEELANAKKNGRYK